MGKIHLDFHERCDGNVQQLVFIKTTKGEIFGGYTEIGFNSRDGSHKDNNAFVFSLYTRKIYNIKTDKTAIYDNQSYGPCFEGNTCIICIYSKMFTVQSHTCSIKDSYFDGITSDFEINNGEQYFNIQEIEVYQILYN